MSSRVVWRCMASDIVGWSHDCQQRNRAKVTSQMAAPIQPIPIPHRRFSHIHVDIMGPLPSLAQGFNYIFTVIDRSSRWIKAVPIKNQEAATCADTLVAMWISRFGVPDTITSDKGTQFCSTT
jgi:IS30 family transposase